MGSAAAALNPLGMVPNLPRAACKTEDPETFFVDDRQPRAIRYARAVCRRCPEVNPCLSWALTNREWGIWAGTTDKERDRIARRRDHAEAIAR